MRPSAITLLGLAGLFAACGGGGNDGAYCTADADCTGGDVCAHTHECLPPDQVHAVTIHWTIGGQAPTATTCSGIGLEVGYSIGGDPASEVLFSPVACTETSFPNDKWPTRFDTAVVIASTTASSTQGTASIPPDPVVDVTIDVAHP